MNHDEDLGWLLNTTDTPQKRGRPPQNYGFPENTAPNDGDGDVAMGGDFELPAMPGAFLAPVQGAGNPQNPGMDLDELPPFEIDSQFSVDFALMPNGWGGPAFAPPALANPGMLALPTDDANYYTTPLVGDAQSYHETQLVFKELPQYGYSEYPNTGFSGPSDAFSGQNEGFSGENTQNLAINDAFSTQNEPFAFSGQKPLISTQNEPFAGEEPFIKQEPHTGLTPTEPMGAVAYEFEAHTPKTHRNLFRKFQEQMRPTTGRRDDTKPVPATIGPENDATSQTSHFDELQTPAVDYHGELSPLTTTTSLTPLVLLIHLTQPLFFSANQHFSRNSVEAGLDFLARPSFDLGKLVRSGPQPLRYNTFLFSNILPFMGERQRSDEVLAAMNLDTQTSPQQRHIIRSIFKTGLEEQPEQPLTMEDAKIKKPKRLIFTRFKLNGVVKEDDDDDDMIKEEEELAVDDEEQPDYAALFEHVGKRKKPVKKEDDVVKREDDDELRDSGSFHDQALAQLLVASSGQYSGGTSEGPFTTALKRILGSKLILGRKKTQPQSSASLASSHGGISVAPTANGKPVATVISKGVEVEVDLSTLDLPPNTQIFPTSIINQKNRTRGRKENKEADMVDLLKIYLCNYCLRRFKRQEHLKRHFRSLHTFEKPYDCTICNKKFSRQDNLNQHLKTHKEEEERAAVEAMAE